MAVSVREAVQHLLRQPYRRAARYVERLAARIFRWLGIIGASKDHWSGSPGYARGAYRFRRQFAGAAFVRIKSVEIENFRSIRNLTCDFGSVTSLVGPNGAGKSNVLRAIDWFFNGDKGQLSDDDIHKGSIGRDDADLRIRVRVNFVDLTDADRAALGPKYCPDADTDEFTAWRTWQHGTDKITGRALAFQPFEVVRMGQSATEKRAAYEALRESDGSLGLPPCRSATAVDEAMNDWERANPDRLTDAEISDTHFFGIAGQGRMSDLFDFVFVSADLRASEETTAGKDTLLSRILQRAVRRDDFDAAAGSLVRSFAEQYASLGDEHLSGQLDDLADELTREVASYSRGRSIRLRNAEPSIRPVAAAVEVLVADLATETPVGLQGHGFQRTLLLAALSVLSKRRRAEPLSGQMFLAIEEPELFQHPTQAKAFASVLRHIASTPGQATQVAYATHNPYFVDPRYFDEVRRVSSHRTGPAEVACTRITQATMDGVAEDLHGFTAARTLARRFDQVCLKYLPDALFAESVILVEGDEDAAVLEGMGDRINDLAVTGVCVAPVEGKGNMLIPFAILRRLGIPVLMVVDNDSGSAGRMRRDGKEAEAIAQAMKKHAEDNRKLCRFVGADEEDFPVGGVNQMLAFVPDTMESLLASDLPGWDLTRRKVIEDGRGVDGKNAATYALTSRECEDEPTGALRDLLDICASRVA